MLRVGVIGLGDIAQKAYLPVVTAMDDVQLVFCTRNQETLRQLASKYRVAETAESVEALLDSGIDAAFVHTATASHIQIVSQLLYHRIPVYVDKPISFHYEDSVGLTELAEQTGTLLMVGFNRRFAPMYQRLSGIEEKTTIHLQKNRLHSPDIARKFIYDDFIHVIDTIRYLSQGKAKDIHIHTHIKDGLLYHVVVQLSGEGYVFTGSMNRDNGANEERLEIISPGNKWVVEDLNRMTHFHGGSELHSGFKDWDPVLYRRGFEPIIHHFLTCVREGKQPSVSLNDALESHRLCEMIIEHAVANGAREIED